MMGAQLVIEFYVYFYIVCSFIIVIVQPIYGHVAAFKGGRCILSSEDIILYNTVYMDCVDECRSRKTCVAISLHTFARVCHLHSQGAMLRPDEVCLGFVTTKREHWKQKRIPGCQICEDGTVCVLDDDGNASCIYKECQRLPTVQNQHMLGNGNKSVGSRLAVTCYDDRTLISGLKTCGIDGQWDGTEVSCGKHVYKFPNTSYVGDFDRYDLLADNISLLGRTAFTFRVKGHTNACILLKGNNDTLINSLFGRSDAYEIILGGRSNSESAIHLAIEAGSYPVRHVEKGILSSSIFRAFWISTDSCIRVGKGNVVGRQQFMELCADYTPRKYIYIAFSNHSPGVFIFG